MNISHFIGASSSLLLAWLGFTYFHQVPSERYPNRDTLDSASTSVEPAHNDGMIAENVSDPATHP